MWVEGTVITFGATVVVGAEEADAEAATGGTVTVIVACAETGEMLSPGSLTVAVLVIVPVAVEFTVTGTVMLPIAGLKTPVTGGTKVQVTVFPAVEQLAEAKPDPVMDGVPSKLRPVGKVSVTVAGALMLPVKAPAMVKLSIPPGETIGCAAVLVRITEGAAGGVTGGE